MGDAICSQIDVQTYIRYVKERQKEIIDFIPLDGVSETVATVESNLVDQIIINFARNGYCWFCFNNRILYKTGTLPPVCDLEF